MLDFLKVSTRIGKRGVIEIYPKFVIKRSSDLMIRGGDFYAIWVEERGLWSTDEQDALQLIDKELEDFAKANKDIYESKPRILYMWDAESGMIDNWHKYCQKQLRDNFNMLDEKLIFSNSETNKKDYASKRLSYPLEEGEHPAFDKLISTLYSEEEKHKIEWAIGAIVSGESKKLQKFMVLYGAAGTGKSTMLNIIQQLFEGYYSVFDAKALGSSSNSFALEAFKTNPLVAIQHDGDLSRIEDNTRLNSLVSHELMTVNEKFKSTYANRFKAFLFMGTNKPVKITDGKSGLIRRLIDVSPSGNKLSQKEYKSIMKQISFELGAIAYYCQQLYLDDPGYYDDYIPTSMMGASNDFYNYIIDSYSVFLKEDGTTLKSAYEMYKVYCDEANVPYPLSKMLFKEELKNYFWYYDDRLTLDGSRVRNYYSGFRTDKFDTEKKPDGKIDKNKINGIEFEEQPSIFDQECSKCPAQYASSKETPTKKWENVTTTLEEIDTSKLHYVKVPENHIVIDFDIKGDDGSKSFERNVEEASKWPKTYAELSKSGSGVHLHYLYSGDVTKLSSIYDENIEVKVFSGKSSLRRKLTKCNDLPIATISSGLPLKGEKMVTNEIVQTEKGLRTTIKKCLNKEIHAGTKPNVDFIYKILDDAYTSGLKYDVSNMYNDILSFAVNSTNHSDYCIKLVSQMKFKSDEPSENTENNDSEIVFYDIEVFPNLFLVNWKVQGKDKPIVRMINPKPEDIENLIKYRLIGFNNRRYDNHIIYGCLLGYTNEQLYQLSKKIISGSRNAFFGEAYNISYTDIYDFASAGNKKSLKKLEIEMGIHHQELGLNWDEPVPEELWTKVAEYCDNDVIATEAAFEYLSADWSARQILADIAGMTVNDTTNSLTTRIIFGNNRKPQDRFNYRDMGDPSVETQRFKLTEDNVLYAGWGDEYTVFDQYGRPMFPGYKFENGKSTYRGEEVGEGGYVYSEPGMYGNVALLDIASMHPSSIIAEQLFGEYYTKRFEELKQARIAIKHQDWDEARTLLDGKLAKYVDKILAGEMTAKQLSDALKTPINSVYGLTSASFDNPCRDPRNIDNIVAKRGALFMINLKHVVQAQGYTVAHIKTDSIKIPDATPEIIQFVMDYGKMYGYTFEHEATYERMCLVNKSTYIAKYDTGEWTATGEQFAVPCVFKKLFSKEEITFNDMCETFAVSKGDLYLDMNENLPDVSMLEKELAVISKGDREHDRQEELKKMIEEGHNMIFVGRVGQFCPVKPGCNGGILYRVHEGKNYAAPGSTGYRWLESEMVKTLEKEEDIDKSYYLKLIDDAIKDISEYGDFEWFVSDDPYVPNEAPWQKAGEPFEDESLPWEVPCGKDTCLGCEFFCHDEHHIECTYGFDLSKLIFEDDSDDFKKR